MSKRSHQPDADSSRPPKRQRAEPVDKPVVEEIHFARQLQDLLVFRQDGIAQLRSGIASFKALLESVLYRKEPDERARQLSILREYLDTQKPADAEDREALPFLFPLWQALSFAVHGQNDPLTSSLLSLLALLLKTLSAVLDLSEYGLLLCRTVLRGEHVGLLKRCLDAPRHKEFVISPAIRLLSEVVGFDGGAVVREVYKRREQTVGWQWVRKCLGMVKSGLDPEELQRKPAIRTLTVRYILSLLKYLHEGGKADLLQNGSLCRALFQNLRDDPQDLVAELLAVTEQHVFKDDELQRSAKAALLAQHNLERVTSIATQPEEQQPAASKAFAWLTAVCTKPSYGILRHSGWYRSGTTQLARRRPNDDSIDLGLDSIDFYDRDADDGERPAVRNPVLLSWLQTLHPWSNLRERELALICFRAAPELVAAYFIAKERSMQLEPKLSNTWIGYASFLFEVVQLPVPERFGHGKEWAQLPPQTTVAMESVLPRPLTRKVLVRCLNQSSELITFFAVRILVLALQKLRTVREMLEQEAMASGQQASLWKEASQRLLERFIEQTPPMKDVIAAFRKIADDEEHALQREAIARLLRLYYEVVQLQALEEPFDVSGALTGALGRAQGQTDATAMTELRGLELEHLLQIARFSPGMRWFGKQGGLRYSPATTLLRLHVQRPQKRGMRDLIEHVLRGGQILDDFTGVEALVASLHAVDVREDAVAWEFLDDCFVRASKKPVKYLDDLGNLCGDDGDAAHGVLGAVFLEQMPFWLQKKGHQPAAQVVQVFLMILQQRESPRGSTTTSIPDLLLERIQQLKGWPKANKLAKSQDVGELLERVQLPVVSSRNEATAAQMDKPADTSAPFEMPPTESENHPELLKWAQKDLDMALEDGDISALVYCLCSQHADIRTQALAQLRRLEDRLIHSSLEDKDPIYVLLGELIETYERGYVASAGGTEPRRLEYLAAAFAAAALKVQMQPTHLLYPKLNRFLNKDPEWRVAKLPGYWIQQTVLATPDADDVEGAYWVEAQWVLDWVVNGLRTHADLEVLRKAGVFERFMALFAAPGVAREVRERVLELMWRAAMVDGGAQMLVKRCGVLAWLDMVKPSRTGTEGWLRGRIVEAVGEEERRGDVEMWAGVPVAGM